MANYPELTTITLPSGTTYAFADEVARQAAAGGIHLIGETSTAITDGASTPTSITLVGESEAHTMVANEAVFNGSKEYVWTGAVWIEWGDLTGLGSLATKNSASGTYTPTGTVSTPAFSGSELTSTGDFTPEGTVAAPTISVATAGSTTSVTPFGTAGSLPSLSMTVSNGNLTISFDQGALPTAGTAVTVKTGDATYSATAPAFTGTQGSVSVTGTPAGTISQPTFTGTQDTVTVS